MDLLNRIEKREAIVSVIGLGYVGLPLAVAFAEAGFQVIGIDVNKYRVERINRGESDLIDIPSAKLSPLIDKSAVNTEPRQRNSKQAGGIRAVSDYAAIENADAAIVCVPTPLSKTKDPDMSYIIAASDEIARRLHPGLLVVLESTTYPGTTEELILPRLESASGQSLKAGVDFFLAFSPERIDPGRTDWTV